MISFDEYFKFPILMVDELNEVRKMGKDDKFGDLPGQEDPEIELDLIVGESEIPINDPIICINDRWIPRKESFKEAQDGKFDCCTVVFSMAGTFCVPLNKETFKKRYLKFMSKLPEKPQPVMLHISKEQMAELLQKDKENEDKG